MKVTLITAAFLVGLLVGTWQDKTSFIIIGPDETNAQFWAERKLRATMVVLIGAERHAGVFLTPIDSPVPKGEE